MTEQSDVVGTASVQLTVNSEGLAEEMQAAVTAAIAALNAELKVAVTAGGGGTAASDASAAQAAPKSAKGAASAQGVDATANITSFTGVNEAIQKAIGSHAFNIGVNGEFLIGSIQRALNDHQFSIQVQIAGDLKLPKTISIDSSSVSPGTIDPHQPPAAKPTLPPAVQRTLAANTGNRDDLRNLYRQVHEAMGTAGKAFGSVDPNVDDDASMLRDLLGAFGDDIQKWGAFKKVEKTGAMRDQGGGSVEDYLRQAGVSDETITTTKKNALFPFQASSAGGTGGTEPLSALVREHAAAIRGTAAPQHTTTITNAQVAQSAPIVQPVAAPAPKTPAQVLAESQAAIEAAKRASAETPTVGAAEKGETRGSARVLSRQSLDEAVSGLVNVLNTFPKGRTQPPPNAFDQERVPKFDPKTGMVIPGEFETVTLTAEEIMQRSQGQLPTPVSPTGRFSYSQLERAAQSGAFSYKAKVIGADDKPTGEYVTYDPTSEDEEIQGFALKNSIFNIDATDAKGRRLRAKPIRPAEYARELILAGDASDSSRQIVPHEDLTPLPGQPEGQAFAERVISKAIPKAATAFDRTIQAIKQNKPLGERSGIYTGADKTLQQLVAADEEYLKAWKAMESLQLASDAMEKGDPSRKRLDQNIEARRSELARLEQQGANPSVALFSMLPPLEQSAAIRSSRERDIAKNALAQQRTASGAGLSPFEKAEAARKGRGGKAGAEDFRNFDIARVALQSMADFAESVRSGKETSQGEVVSEMVDGKLVPKPFSLISAEGKPNVPEGYELRETQEASRANIVRQNLAKIMDDFKKGIGEKPTGDTSVPRDYGSILGPMVGSVFRDLAGEAGPGQPALRSSVSPGDRRKLASVSFAEQDRVRAEAATFRSGRAPNMLATDIDVQVARLRGAEMAPAGGGAADLPQYREPRTSPARARQNKIEKAAELEALYSLLDQDFKSRGEDLGFTDDSGQVQWDMFKGHLDTLKQTAIRGKGGYEGMEPKEAESILDKVESIKTTQAFHKEKDRIARDLEASVPAAQLFSPERVEIDRLRGVQRQAELLTLEVAGASPEQFQSAPDEKGRTRTMTRLGRDPRISGSAVADRLRGLTPAQVPDKYLGGRREGPFTNAEQLAALRDPDHEQRATELLNEAIQQIETGTAHGFTKAEVKAREQRGVESAGGLTGDETRRVTQEAGVHVAGEMPPPSAEAGGGGGRSGGPTHTGLTPGGPNGPEGGDGSHRVSGGIQRVLVMNSSLAVHMAGSVAPPSGEARASVANSKSGFEYAQARQAIRDARGYSATTDIRGPGGPGNFVMPGAGPEDKGGRAFRLYQKLRDEGLDDPAIKKTLGAMGYGAAAEIIMGRLNTDEDGGGGGGVGGVASDRAARRKRLGLAPLEAKNNEFFAQVDEADTSRAKLSAIARRAERGIPKRGFTASVTDIFGNIGGALDEQVASVSRFQREGGELSSLLAKGPKIAADRASLQEEFDALQGRRAPLEESLAAATNKKERRAATDALTSFDKELGTVERQLNAANKAHAEYNNQLEFQTKAVQRAESALPGLGARVGAFAIGGLAAGGAFAVGSLVVQATTMVMEGVAAAIGPSLERALGDFGTTAKYVGVAGEAQLAAGGRQPQAQAGFAQAVGLSFQQAGSFGPVLEEGEMEAGNKRLQEIGGALRALQNIEKNGPRGTFEGTSGFLGSFINQVPATAQIVAGIAQDFVGPRLAPPEFRNVPVPGSSPYQMSMDNIESIGAVDPMMIGVQEIQRYANLQQQQMVNLQRGEAAGGGVPTTGVETTMVPNPDWAVYQEQLAYTTTALEVLNTGLERGGEKVAKFTNAVELSAETQQQADILRAKGATELADAIEQGKIALVDQSGRALTDVDQITAALGSLARGVLKPDAENMLASTSDQRRAQAFLGQGQFNLQTETLIPAKFALQEAMAPIGDLLRPLRALGVGGGGGIERLLSQIGAQSQAGKKTAIDFVANGADLFGTGQMYGGLGPEEGVKFSAALERAASFGQRISDLQIDVQTQRAALSAEQYAFQHFQAARSLRDAKGLTGEIGQADRDNLGVLERRQFLLQREAQSLQLGLSQKQINFQVALAGFTAPGDTPQERAARIRQAQIEADFAQKQLDIQKELFGLQGRSFQITASRQVRDLGRQLGLLERGHEVEIRTAKAEAKIRALTALQARENAKVEAFFDRATARTTDMLGLSAQLVAETGEGLVTVTNQVIGAFRKTFAGIREELQDASGGEAAGGTAAGIIARREKQIGKDLNNNGRIGAARGFAGMTKGLTDFTVGEVEGEAVVVLKSPRNMAPSSMGQGSGDTYNITITGNDFKSERDMDILVQKLEQALSKKGSLMGYRRPF